MTSADSEKFRKWHFEKWLQENKNLSKDDIETTGIILSIICEKYTHLMNNYCTFFLMTTVKEVDAIINNLTEDAEFNLEDKEKGNEYYEAIQLYYDYVFEEQKNDISKRENPDLTNLLEMPRRVINKPLPRIGVSIMIQPQDLSLLKLFELIKPVEFVLQDEIVIVNCWCEVIIYLSDLLFSRYPYLMNKIIDKPIGMKNLPIFTENLNGDPYLDILENGLFVATELSAYDLFANAKILCKQCGLLTEEFEIHVENTTEYYKFIDEYNRICKIR